MFDDKNKKKIVEGKNWYKKEQYFMKKIVSCSVKKKKKNKNKKKIKK